MKKFIFAVLAVCSLSLGAVKAMGIDDLGTPPGCSVFANESGSSEAQIESPNAMIQYQLTPSGNVLATCHGNFPLPPPASTIVLTSDDFIDPVTGNVTEACDTSHGESTEWHLVITKSGKVSLTCHIRPE